MTTPHRLDNRGISDTLSANAHGEAYTLTSPSPLSELILAHKGGRTWQEMSDACGGVYGPKRLSQIANDNPRIKTIPEPWYLEAIATACGVSTRAVLMAAAETVGLPVDREESTFLSMMLTGTETLTEDQRENVYRILRSYIDANRAEATTKTKPVRKVPPKARTKT